MYFLSLGEKGLMTPIGAGLTAVDADPELELLAVPMPDLEVQDFPTHVQRHLGDLARVPTTVPDRQTRHHHVSITDGLHLPTKRCD